MELGRYDAARARFGALYGQRTNLAVAPRLARWLELEGQVEEARASRQAGRPWKQYDGHDWQVFAPGEKRA